MMFLLAYNVALVIFLQVFHNCSCVLSPNSTAILGQCPREEKCDTMLLYFMILNLVCCFIYSLGAMPGYMVLIR